MRQRPALVLELCQVSVRLGVVLTILEPLNALRVIMNTIEVSHAKLPSLDDELLQELTRASDFR